jgi:hypothetical protein
MINVPASPFLAVFGNVFAHQNGTQARLMPSENQTEHSFGRAGLSANQGMVETDKNEWPESWLIGEQITKDTGETFVIAHIYPPAYGWIKATLRSLP